VFTGGAAPTPALLERCETLGWNVTHLYGLTETYGPQVICEWRTEWDELPIARRAAIKARRGVATMVSELLRVVDDAMTDVPRDGETLGEVVMRGNNVTLGYYRDEEATRAAFSDGWFHTGDLGVLHANGYIELHDRGKDRLGRREHLDDRGRGDAHRPSGRPGGGGHRPSGRALGRAALRLRDAPLGCRGGSRGPARVRARADRGLQGP
jgi:acyl-CoA synthetase (AMP-forming)/AMP-acid ligase II